MASPCRVDRESDQRERSERDEGCYQHGVGALRPVRVSNPRRICVRGGPSPRERKASPALGDGLAETGGQEFGAVSRLEHDVGTVEDLGPDHPVFKHDDVLTTRRRNMSDDLDRNRHVGNRTDGVEERFVESNLHWATIDAHGQFVPKRICPLLQIRARFLR